MYTTNRQWQIILGSQLSDNTPPIMWLDRNWRLPETEQVGNVITRVRAEDTEQDKLTYGLEPHDYNGKPLPFFIDNSTGIVFLNETLKGRVSTFANYQLLKPFILDKNFSVSNNLK